MKSDFSKALPRSWQSTAKVFTALGHEHRQRILLMFERGEQLNVSQIVEASTLSRTAVVHHLKVLHDAKVLRRKRVGKEACYWIDKSTMENALEDVLEFIRANL